MAGPVAFASLRARDGEQELTRWDPKDGELCLNREKSEETLMEARNDPDVQIGRGLLV